MDIKNVFKYRNIKVLRSGVVLMMDVTVSALVAILSILFQKELNHLPVYTYDFFCFIIVSTISALAAFYITKSYRRIIRHSNMPDMLALFATVILKEVFVVCIYGLLWHFGIIEDYIRLYFWIVLILDMALLTMSLIIVRAFIVTIYFALRSSDQGTREKLLVYGIGHRSYGLIAIMDQSRKYEIVGFLNYDARSIGQKILNYRVWPLGSIDDLEIAYIKTGAKYLLFPTLTDLRREQDRAVQFCHSHNIKMLIAPDIDNIHQNGNELKLGLREISIEDVLGRDEITIDMRQVSDAFRGKCVMVTGAAGSIGSELCRQLANVGVSKLIMFDNAETPLHNLSLEMEEKFGANVNDGASIEFSPIIGDVRQLPRLEMCFERFHPEVVFHAAAYKHVPMMESNPCEAVFVNVIGTRNVADCCVKYKVSNMIMISTDKAVNPTNVMGATKRAAEMYVQSLGHSIVSGKLDSITKFTTTRFGNVLGSNGSVIPRFKDQIKRGGPLTVTSKEITRFFMSIPEATRLVLEAATMGRGCDIFIFDMGAPVKIYEMAKKMVELAGYTPEVDIQIDITGLRPGEKITEELLKDAEKTQATKNEKIFITNAREADYNEVNQAFDELRVLAAEKMDLRGTVKRLKELVPEYKSQNSIYEALDK